MNLPKFSVERPIFTSMITLLILILGGIALTRLPVDLLPDIERPELSVSTAYENASPQEVETSITRPLEQSLGAVNGVQELLSTSTEGNSSIEMSFTWGTDLDAASNNVRDRIDRVLKSLPEEVVRPQVQQFSSSQMPILRLGFASDMDPLMAREYVDDFLVYRLERLPGVAAVSVGGGLTRQIRVELDIDRIKALGISFNDLIDRIKKGNLDTPGGNIDAGAREVRVRIPGAYTNLDELRDTTIMNVGGAPVKLRDVAQVIDGAADRRSINRIDGQSSIRLQLNKQSGSNTVAVADAAIKEIGLINRELPQGRLVILNDSAEYIRQSIDNVTMSAIEGGVLAVFVLLFFLSSLASTFVVAVSIPVSLVACFTLIYFAGYTMNIMSLGGLALGIGMLVDASIVVLENIVQKRDGGLPLRAAALAGTTEVDQAILSSTLTHVVVFLPLLFIAGMAGLLFRQLAAVVAFSLLCSYVAAVTLIPMLAARWLGKSAADEGENLLARAAKGLLTGLDRFYARILGSSLRRPWRVVAITSLIIATSVALAPFMGTELMPATDESEVAVSFEMEPGTRLEEVEKKVVEMEGLIRGAVPELRVLQSSAGGGGGGGGHASSLSQGSFNVKLVPRTQRKRSSARIAQDLNKVLAPVAGVKVRCRVSSSMLGRLVGGSGDNTVDIDVRGYDLATGRQLAAEIARRAEQIPGVTDTEVPSAIGVPELNIQVDRRKAADLDLAVQDVANALRTVIAGTTAGRYRLNGKEYDILVRVKDADKMAIDDILDLTITNRKGQSVVLRNILRDEPGTGPSAISRKDRERVITVKVNAPGRDLGTVVSDVQAALADLPIPQGFALVYSGSFEEQQRSFNELAISFLLALVLTYIVMACQFESLRDPLVIMFSVPLASIGVVAALLLTGTTLNIQSFIGCIMLAGIVVSNAILLVDQTNLLRREGLAVEAALREAGRRRLRPILMTALATILGLLPLALGLRDGSEAQAPLARAVIGGLISSTMITLVFVPVVYTLFAKFWKEHRDDVQTAEPVAAETPVAVRVPA